MVGDLLGNLNMNFKRTKQKINDFKGFIIVKIIINNFRFQDFIKSILLFGFKHIPTFFLYFLINLNKTIYLLILSFIWMFFPFVKTRFPIIISF